MMSNKLSPNMFDEMPMDRKDKKPLMERKRRARMNDSLNELKNLILFISPQLKSKLEKADILELTVHYFRQLVSLQMNSLSSLNVPPGYIEDEGKCLKKEQKLDYNLIDNKLLQTPNGASFLSPPSSVSPDYDTNNTNLFSLNGDTPSYYGINRKRKQKFDEYKNDYLPNTLHSLGSDLKHQNLTVLQTPYYKQDLSLSDISQFQKLSLPFNFPQSTESIDKIEEKNKKLVWRPWQK